MIPPASCWSSSGDGPHGRLERRVVRVERRRREQDHDREERVLGHLQEHVHAAGRMGHAPRRRIEADGRPPEQQRRAEEQDVLEVVDPRVLERQVEQRREVGCPTSRPRRRSRRRPGGRSRGVPGSGGPAGSSAAARPGWRPGAAASPARRARSGAPRRGSAARAGPCGPRTARCRTASMPDRSANAIAVSPPRKKTVRARGTGDAGWAAFTRRVATTHATADGDAAAA